MSQNIISSTSSDSEILTFKKRSYKRGQNGVRPDTLTLFLKSECPKAIMDFPITNNCNNQWIIMARRPRFHFPGATYHVMLRGNNGKAIFTSDEERCRFCFLIQEGVERFGHQIYAFCFMTNHIHLALKVNDVPLSKIIQNLSFRYTRFFNWRHNVIGHLFQGRFKSVLVDGSRYLKHLIRYIHLNPVRANMVDIIVGAASGLI